MKRVVGEIVVLVAVAVICGTAANAWRSESNRLAWLARPQPAGSAGAPAARLTLSPEPLQRRGRLFIVISGELAYRLQRSGVLFVDARRTEAYEKGHIPGARSIPAWEGDTEKRIAALRAEGVAVDREIVVYCSGPDCEDSERLADKLTLAGFFNLHVYKDGFPDWKSRGWPIVEGRKP